MKSLNSFFFFISLILPPCAFAQTVTYQEAVTEVVNFSSGTQVKDITANSQQASPSSFSGQGNTVTLTKVGEGMMQQPRMQVSESEVRIELLISSTNALKYVDINGESGFVDLKTLTVSSKPITLVNGPNDVWVEVVFQDGQSLKGKFTITRKEKLTVNKIYLLAIGISNFQNTEYNLKYAANDANDIANLFESQKQKGVFQSVTTKRLINEQATRININRELKNIEGNVGPDDLAVIFLTSHGASMNGDKFYLVAHDSNASEDFTCVSWSEIATATSNLNCRVLMLIDACHAGALGNNLIASSSGNKSGVSTGIDKALEDLKQREVSTYILSSSRSTELSYEHANWQNGAFTEALIEGLGGKANLIDPEQKVVYFSELAEYVQRRVPELVQGVFGQRQTPQQKLEGDAGKLPIVVVD